MLHQHENKVTSGQVDSSSTEKVDYEKAVSFHEDASQEVFDEPATKRLLRKMDIKLLPFLALLYLLSFLDRTNIGNAKLAGLEEALGMTGKWDYNIAVAVFFPFYVAAEIPSNMAMKRFRPSIWIPSIMIAWAIVTTLMGITHNFGGFLATRMALGLAEGGLFPGITYYITLWYKRHECGLRMMNGLGGLDGWAWIFIIEGLITFVFAIMAFFVMHDYPDTAKFLNDSERKEVLRRLEEDRSVLSDAFNMKFAKDALKDWKIWSLGYTNEMAQLMSVPPYVVACLFTIGGGFAADRHGQRGIYMIFFCVVAIIGFIILATVDSHGAKYFAAFLITCGIYPNVPQGVAWNGNNIGGSLKRGVGIAMHVGFGNLGGAVSGFVYRKDDAPDYRSGHWTLVATTTMSCILSILMTIYLRRENARRDQTHKAPHEYTRAEKELEQDSGDNATFFRYTV
ncbi:Major facilitator superfamily [Fusarium oxysporum f. sp. vasinfectum]|nr:Major facilitator superfamily [Fusarium oxysporum f. sp. vasinfectum]KAK2927651.1 Major facilitator superfamily [Fusarium oxysporum f. sp. vasinfectum]WKT49808.1 Major facilitator superfamily [Fusarium oxysporum f. sp. vasinfectum]